MNREAKHLEAQSAELSVLGTVLLDNACIDTIGTKVKPEDFYDQRHAHLFGQMLGMVERGEPVDPISLATRLEQEGTLERVGGVEYLLHLSSAVVTTVNAEHHAKIVSESAAIRRAALRLGALVETAKTGQYETADAFFDRVQAEALDMAPERDDSYITTVKAQLKPTLKAIQDAYNTKRVVVGLPSGITALDEQTTGFGKGGLTIVAARPSMGKTAFLLGVARAIAKLGLTVNLHELEMPTSQLMRRLVAQEAKVPGQDLKTGHIKDTDLDKIFHAIERMSDLPIVINDKPAQTLMDIRAMARQTAMDKSTPPLGAILIDYAQIAGLPDNKKRHEAIGAFAMGCKNLAKEMDVPVILLSQLNRSLESRPNKRPMMSDLKESGALEEAADDVIFIYRDEVYNHETEKPGVAEFIAAKVREGATGTVEAAWVRECTLFSDLAQSPRF